MALSCYSRLLVLLFATLCLGSAVFASDSGEKASSDAVLQRAREYWQFKIKGEFDKALALENPELVKNLSVEDYVKTLGSGVKWLSVEPEKAVIEGNQAGVHMKVRYMWTFVAPAQQPEQGMESFFWDQWSLIDGKWYHQYQSYQQKAEKIKEITSGKLGDQSQPAPPDPANQASQEKTNQ